MAVAVDQLLHQSGNSAQEISWALERIKCFPGLRIWEFFLGCHGAGFAARPSW
jgi:hypothetical protein